MKLKFKSTGPLEGIVTDEFGNEYFGAFTDCGEGFTLYTKDTREVITTVPVDDIERVKPHEGSPLGGWAPNRATLEVADTALSSIHASMHKAIA